MAKQKKQNDDKENTFINKSVNLIKDRKFDDEVALELLEELQIGGIEDED